MKTRLISLISVLVLIFSFAFENYESELKQIFQTEDIDVKIFILKIEQVKEIEKLSGVSCNFRFVSFYIAKKKEKIIGYGYIDTHIIRGHPEIVLYAINPSGEIEHIRILHSEEPPEHSIDEKWLRIFKGKSIEKDQIRLRKDIPNITGATLSAKAITDNARKVLAIWKILFGK